MNTEIESIFENFGAISNYGITVNDLNGRYLFVNDYFCEIVGYSKQELLENDFSFLTHPDDVGKNIDLGPVNPNKNRICYAKNALIEARREPFGYSK